MPGGQSKTKQVMLLTWFNVWLRKWMDTGLSPYFSGRLRQSHTLTHPDFPELPGTKPFHQLDGIPWDLPGIFVPWLLWFGANTRLLQSSAQAI